MKTFKQTTQETCASTSGAGVTAAEEPVKPSEGVSPVALVRMAEWSSCGEKRLPEFGDAPADPPAATKPEPA